MEKPVIELKNLKYAAFASEETHCYEATLYVDGKAWGIVSNEGRGGCDYFRGANGRTNADMEALNKQIAATFPPYEFDGQSLPYDLEMICGELVDQWLIERDFRKAMKNAVLFTKPDVAGIWQIKVRKPNSHAATLAAIKAKFPNYRYLSDMPIAEAMAVYAGQ